MARGAARRRAGVALVAVGGYGRKELLPRSDLDVLLLHGGRDDIAGLADRIWYPVWDSGVGARPCGAHRAAGPAGRAQRPEGRARAARRPARGRRPGPDRAAARGRARGLARGRAARLAELHAACDERARTSGELAFLLEPDLKEARGGLRDVHAIQAVAAAWVAPGPGPRVRTAYEQILDARHALHEVTGRRRTGSCSRNRTRWPARSACWTPTCCCGCWPGAARTVALRGRPCLPPGPDRLRGRRPAAPPGRAPARWPMAWLSRTARWSWPGRPTRRNDPGLVLRAAAAAAQAGLPLAPRTPGPAGRMPAAARAVARGRARFAARAARRGPGRGQRVGGAGRPRA